LSSVSDPGWVREQYASEANLAARKSVYARIEGPDTPAIVFRTVAECRPQRVLEVGGGEGELAQRVGKELGAELIGIDQSERMVAIQREKGIDARVGTVAGLPFADGEFDTAIAAWMLYHVDDLDGALSELARLLRRGGRLVAVTNSLDHLRELWDLAGRETSARAFQFRSENGEDALRRHFRSVTRRDVDGWVIMDDDAVRRYAASWTDLAAAVDRLPLREPLRVRRSSSIFVAER
jgi:SAM-dependent methyltransferase